MGVVGAVCLTAFVSRVAVVTTTSTPERTSSLTRRGKFSGCPLANARFTARLRPST